MEAMQKKDIEVLFCYENYDELVLMNLAQYDKKYLKSVENELVDDKSDTSSSVDEGWSSISCGSRSSVSLKSFCASKLFLFVCLKMLNILLRILLKT